MGVTKYTELNAPQARLRIVSSLPTSPYVYYDAAVNDVDSTSWKGGELAYLTVDNRLYMQSATSGTTPSWRRYLTAFVAA